MYTHDILDARMRTIDLTHEFTPDMPSYPGDPKAELTQVATITKDTFTDHKVTTTMHVGTHMDAPLHMIEGGAYMSQIPLEQCFGPGVLVDARGTSAIDVDSLTGITVPEHAIVLVWTGYSAKYRTPDYFSGYPAMTEGFAHEMVKRKVKIVGMDILGPDHDTPWPAHKILLGNGTLIIENLTNLDQLVGVKTFEIIALPAKFQTDAAPVRVVATVK